MEKYLLITLCGIGIVIVRSAWMKIRVRERRINQLRNDLYERENN
jgi:hypothetical protein